MSLGFEKSRFRRHVSEGMRKGMNKTQDMTIMEPKRGLLMVQITKKH